jgi:hypothetical protein
MGGVGSGVGQDTLHRGVMHCCFIDRTGDALLVVMQVKVCKWWGFSQQSATDSCAQVS